jgi:hypothetical protein
MLFIKKYWKGLCIGGIFGLFIPLFIFLLTISGIHGSNYSLLDYFFILGYIVSSKIFPSMNFGLVNLRIIVDIILNAMYWGLIGILIEKYLLRRKNSVDTKNIK